MPHLCRFVLLALCATVAFGRVEIPLVSGWKFIREDAGIGAVPDEKWAAVSVPHTWNAVDGANGRAADPRLPDGYYRGPAWYSIALPLPADWAGRKIYVRFEAVATVADVFIGDRHVGQHRGAFTAFVFDLTPFLRPGESNVLNVRADNSRFPDVAPLSGDFTIHGGLYRPVTLIVAEPTHVAFVAGSRGVFAHTRRLTAQTAELEVRSSLVNESADATDLALVTTVTDRAGQTVATTETKISLAPHETRELAQSLALAQPHRWHGRRDPYLYQLAVSVRRGTREIDRVVQSLGLRTVAIDEARGFLLNGEPYPIRGVSRHQDRAGFGWALSPEQEREDLRLIADIGATAIRLAHYPQSECIHALADELGLLLWEEIPNIERIPSLPEFFPNLQQQLREMVLQGYNSPSIAWWGLFNEAKAVWQTPLGAPPEKYHDQLRRDVLALDDSRLIVGASWLRHHDPLHDSVPYPAFNQYPGWKYDQPDDMGPIIDTIYANHGKRIAIAEYGAGASPHHHLETGLAPPKSTETPFHPEEWQAIVHEGNWRHLADNPKLWGSFAWVMFDFSADYRNEGEHPGYNDKGLVTADRATKKDAYFFYQANWTTVPMVHLTSKRMTTRQLNPAPEIKVYSNCATVELVVNGQSLGKKSPDRIAVCRWENVALQPGANRVEAIGRHADGAEVRDAAEWSIAAH
jgi:beta-galactosidase